MRSLLRSIPNTATVTLVAVAAFFLPSAEGFLELTRDTLDSGQWWRLLTGHLAHCSASHLFWDVLMFAGLGAWVERELGARRFLLFLGMQALAVSFVVLATLPPHLATYRGLSGLDSGLFVAAVLLLRPQLRPNLAWLPTVLLLLFLGKSLWEVFTGTALFVTDSTFEPVPSAHLAGAAAAFGLMLGIRITHHGGSSGGCPAQRPQQIKQVE